MKYTWVIALLIITPLLVSPSATMAETPLKLWVCVEEPYKTAIEGLLQDSGKSVTVIYVAPSSLENQLINAKINGSLPDAVITDNLDIPQMVTRGVAKSLSISRNKTLYPGIERTVVYYSLTADGMVINGTYAFYGIPLIARTTALYINTDFWDKEIKTLDDFYDAALRSNDQTNPLDPKYGFGFTDLPDPALALFYGNQSYIFRDMVIDVKHLAILDAQQVGTLSMFNWMANERQLNPPWDEQGTTNVRHLFAETGKLAMMIDGPEAMQVINGSTVFGESMENLRVIPVPGNGAPLRSIALVPTKETNIESVQDLGTALLNYQLQEKLYKSYSLLPVIRGVLNGEPGSAEYAFNSTLTHGKQLPITPRWKDIETIFSTEMSKLLKGDQNQTRTAIAMDIGIRPLISLQQEWSPIPIFEEPTESEQQQSSTPITTVENTSTSETPYSIFIALLSLGSLVIISRWVHKKRVIQM